MSRPIPTSRRQATALGMTARMAVLALFAVLLVSAPEAPEAPTAAAGPPSLDTRRPALTATPPDRAMTAQSIAGGEDLGAVLRQPGRLLAREAVAPFDLLGLTFATAPAGDVLARGRVDSAWTPWMPVELDPDHRPEGRERAAGAASNPGVHSEPLWFGGADAYEVSVPGGTSDVQVHLVRPTQSAAAAPQAIAATAPVAGGPTILTRSQWGARPPKETPSVAPDFKVAVVHHSVTNNTYGPGDVPALLRSIQTYHMDVQGWDDIAYNFAVDRFGRIWEARAGGVTKAVIGGHAQGFNTYSTGVMVLGDFTSATPPQASVDAVAHVIGWKFAIHGVEVRGSTQFTSMGSPRYPSGTMVQLPRIVGHRDVGQTSCPGSQLYSRLGEIRRKAAAVFDLYIAQQPETPLFGDFDGDGLRDVVRYRPGSPADVLWSHPGTGRSDLPLVIAGTYRPVVGDFDGDGRDDILWYAPGTDPGDRLWYGRAGGFTSTVVDLPEQGLPVVAELDGDGVDDVVVYAPGGSPDRIYSGQRNRSLLALPLGVDLTYDLSAGDFDGDGRDDLFWFGYGKNPDVFTFSEGAGRFTSVASEPAPGGSSLPFVGDFDGNGQDDLLWYGPGDAPDALWWSEPLVRGLVLAEPLRVRGTAYRPQVGDVNGDGADDLLWYAPGPSADPLWGWPVARLRLERVLSVGGTFVPDLGRYTGDALDDIAWMSPTSASYLWVATGGGSFRSAPLG